MIRLYHLLHNHILSWLFCSQLLIRFSMPCLRMRLFGLIASFRLLSRLGSTSLVLFRPSIRPERLKVLSVPTLLGIMTNRSWAALLIYGKPCSADQTSGARASRRFLSSPSSEFHLPASLSLAPDSVRSRAFLTGINTASISSQLSGL